MDGLGAVYAILDMGGILRTIISRKIRLFVKARFRGYRRKRQPGRQKAAEDASGKVFAEKKSGVAPTRSFMSEIRTVRTNPTL